MRYCPHCMRPTDGERCSHCGGSLQYQSEPHQLPAGTVLNGGTGQGYVLGAVLGQGGFGITYIGVEQTLGRRVAVKEYFPIRCALRCTGNRVEAKPGQEAVYQGGMRSFLQEAKMLAALEDLPCVVRVRSYFEENGTAYLVMEYLDGQALHQKLAREGVIPPQVLLPKLEPLIRDLGKLHQSGLIHRDISPDNLMWMPDGSLKLLDFGSARSMEDGKSMAVVLKPGFAPVEQYQSRGQGPWTDVYALSATIYYCLTGIIPPAAPERLDDDQIRLPAALGVALTPEQEGALMWGLTVQPKMRPANMEVFAQQLFQDSGEKTVKLDGGDQPVNVGGGTVTNGGKSKGKPQKKWLLVGAAGAAAVIGLCVLLSLGGGDDKPNPTSPITASQPSAAPLASEPVEPSAPAVISGETEDGYTYTIEDGAATLTGYTATIKKGAVLSMPDEIDGVQITGIAANAFAGQSGLESIYFPVYLEDIGAGAFRGCTNLRDIYLYSDPDIQEDTFSGCERLRCVVAMEDGLIQGDTTGGSVEYYAYGQDTGAGTLRYVVVTDDGVIYGVTKDDVTVVMDIPAGLSSVTLEETVRDYPVTWVYEKALDDADSDMTVYMSQNLTFPCELAGGSVDWAMKDSESQVTFAYNWYVTCLMVIDMNAKRPGSAPAIAPDEEYVRVAVARAEELSQSYASTRPDGSEWTSLLNEMSVDWNIASTWRKKLDPDEDNLAEELDEIVESWAEPEEDYDDQYRTQLGAALYIGEDGLIYVSCFANIP